MKSPVDPSLSRSPVAGPMGSALNRRDFVKLAAWAAMGALLPGAAIASDASLRARERYLALYNLHTREILKTVYWVDGQYVEDSLRDINYLLRDRHSNEVHAIDTRLLDLLFAIGRKIQAREPFHVVSAYRSPSTNSRLRQRTGIAAENSLHLMGQAVDVRIPGQPPARLRRIAAALKRGGVGYYPRSAFVHIDVGDIRYW